MKKTTLILLGFSVYLLGCEEDKKRDFTAEYTAYATAWCTAQVECCNSDEDIDQCVNTMVASLSEVPENMKIHEGNMELCLEWRESEFLKTCDEPMDIVSTVCSMNYVGTLKQGEYCANDGECEPDLYCKGSEGCQPKGNIGDECDILYNFPCIAQNVCVDGTCSAPLDIGETCTYAFECGSDYNPAVNCIDHVCTALGGHGDPCNPESNYNQCISGICDSQTNTCADKTIAGQCIYFN